MPQEPEEIRQEMDETRDSLTEKISLLEKQVTDTVQEATDGVRETVQSVKSAVEDTVQTVRDTVGDTVDSVKESFNLRAQVQRRPWVVMAGGLGLGFAAGYILAGPDRTASPARAGLPTAELPPTPPMPVPRSGNGSHRAPEPAMSPREPSRTSALVDTLTQVFGNEINQLKGLAIGALGGIVRDFVVRSAPQTVRTQLSGIIDEFTHKMGGEPIKGQVLSEDWNAGAGAREEGTPQEGGGGYRNPRQTSYSSN